jgi:catechol 2,3-dioxygenase-like lactoylglutathione lyase family enzyme
VEISSLEVEVNVTGITWAGTRTNRFQETVHFFSSVMGMELVDQQQGFASLRASDGDKIEVFGPEDRDHDFMTAGPVVGFGVADVDSARAELESSGVEFIGRTHSEGDYRWAHFRGPDGHIYEITSS